MAAPLDDFFIDHLPYEIWMMRQAMKALAMRQLGSFESNAFLEVFCLHARNLINFFKSKKESCDFDPRSFAVPEFRLNTRFVADSALPRINEQVSHLSKRRRAKPAEKLNLGEMVTIHQDIEAEIDRFVGHLRPERKVEWESSIAANRVSIQFAGGMHALTTTTTSASVSTDFRMRSLHPSSRETKGQG